MNVIKKTRQSFKNLFNRTVNSFGAFHKNIKASMGPDSRLTFPGKLKNHFKVVAGILAATAGSVFFINDGAVDFQSAATAMGGAIGGVILALDGLDNMVSAGKKARALDMEAESSEVDFMNIEEIANYQVAFA